MTARRLLIIAQQRRKPSIDKIYTDIVTSFSASSAIIKIDPHDYKNLYGALDKFSAFDFDVVFFDMPHHYMRNQAKALNQLKKAVIYEQDACQEFMPDSRWKGDFSHFYRQIPGALILNTGYFVSDRLQNLGIRSRFVPKGFDPVLVHNLHLNRQISLGFIGAFRSDAYIERYRLLDFMQLKAALQIIRTTPGHEYNAALNRINIFFSADAGIGEYMHKNFEAMAAGCLLLAFRQGNKEEERLGLIDGYNCLLYSTEKEALEKYSWARNNPATAMDIAHNGEQHVLNKFTFSHIACAMLDAIEDFIGGSG